MKVRLDQLLVQNGLAPSRTKSHDLIRAGEIEIFNHGDFMLANNPAMKVAPETVIRLRDGAETLKYVSRGGLKLESALDQTGVRVHGKICLDVGQSTGGFTDVLLKNGATEVWGIDVGKDQIHRDLRNDPRVRFFESLDIRQAKVHPELNEKKFDLIVADLSFISLEKAVDEIYDFLKEGGESLMLVKPQFELDRKSLTKGGLVKDESRVQEVEARLREKLRATGFNVASFFASEVKGKDGNQEYFFHVTKI